MKIMIFGSTGRTGRHIVKHALEAGFQIRAFTRSPEKLSSDEENLTVIEGDMHDFEQVHEALHGADAVISVLGPTDNKAVHVISRGMENILRGMRENEIDRLVVSVGAGVGDPHDKPTLIDKIFNVLLQSFSKNVYEDMGRVADLVRASDLAWTLVRAPMLTDDPGTGDIRVGYLGDNLGIRLSREDFATFILHQVDDSRYLRKAPVISN